MTAVRDGDASRLALLFNRCNKPLYRYIFHLTGQEHQSEDLVQEVFFRILRYSRSFCRQPLQALGSCDCAECPGRLRCRAQR